MFCKFDIGTSDSLPLDPNGDDEKGASDGHDLPAHLLAIVSLGLSSPVQELDDVLGHLRGSGGSLVVILDETVVEDTSHGNTGTGEVRVEVQALWYDGASWGLLGVTGKEGKDVVATAVSGLDDERKIRRQSTVVGGTGGLVVLVWAGQVVGELSGALLNVALVIGLGVVLVLLGKSLGLVDSHEVADDCPVGNTLERVARSADFAVDLETSAKGAVVVGLVCLLMLPRVCCGVESVLGAGQYFYPNSRSRSATGLFKGVSTNPSSAGVMACAGRTNCW